MADENLGRHGEIALPVRGLPKGYLPTLDGWRAIAILAVVVLNHDQIHFLGQISLEPLRWDGHYGVDLFFAISGILICTRLLEEEKLDGKINLKRFYIRRFFRIQPAAWVYLAVISILMMFHVLDAAPKEVLYAALMVRNYFPLHDSPHAWYTAHFWSLAVEEHFYLILPGFLVLFRRHRIAMMSCILLLLEGWRIFLRYHPGSQHGRNFEIRTDVAVLGILLASWFALVLTHPAARAWFQRWLRPWIAVSLIIGVRLWFRHEKGELTDFALRSSFSLLVISTMLHPTTIVGRILESPVLGFLGRISYSIYLWQMLFFTFFGVVPPPHWGLLRYVQNSGWRYVAVLATALLSYYLIEKPMIRVGHRMAKSPVPGRGEFQKSDGELIEPG